MAEIDAKQALEENAAGRKGASAAAGSIRAQRADFYENNVGKFLSIEANVDGVTYTGANQNVYNGPTVMAEWFDAAGNQLGGARSARTRTRTSPPTTTSTTTRSSGSATRATARPRSASIKVASNNGDVDTLAAKEWISKNPPPNAATFKSGFVTRYYDSPDAYAKVRALAAEFPNIA